MTIVQSGLPLALSIPFLLATWIGFVDRHRCVVSQDNGTYATVATGNIDPAISCFDATFVDLDDQRYAKRRSRWKLLPRAMGTDRAGAWGVNECAGGSARVTDGLACLHAERDQCSAWR